MRGLKKMCIFWEEDNLKCVSAERPPLQAAAQRTFHLTLEWLTHLARQGDSSLAWKWRQSTGHPLPADHWRWAIRLKILIFQTSKIRGNSVRPVCGCPSVCGNPPLAIATGDQHYWFASNLHLWLQTLCSIRRTNSQWCTVPDCSPFDLC